MILVPCSNQLRNMSTTHTKHASFRRLFEESQLFPEWALFRDTTVEPLPTHNWHILSSSFRFKCLSPLSGFHRRSFLFCHYSSVLFRFIVAFISYFRDVLSFLFLLFSNGDRSTFDIISMHHVNCLIFFLILLIIYFFTTSLIIYFFTTYYGI